MQSIQIDGTYTYADSVKTLKIGEPIKLMKNTSNRMNKEAIGAYTISGNKIGYVPFKSTQLDLKAKYFVSKISLNQGNPILLISMDWPNTNSIHCEPSCVTAKNNTNAKFIDVPDELSQDLKKFAKSLQNSGYVITKIGICELTNSYVTVCIQTPESTNFFYTVTKSFYESNIFKYDEFYKFGLTPKCIYVHWQTHRLEKYLEFNYKPASKIFSGKKFKWDNLMESGVFEGLDAISLSGPNCSMGLIESDELILFNKKTIPAQVKKSDLEDWAKLTIQYNTKLIECYNPENLISDSLVAVNLTKLHSLFDNLEPGGLAYNHKLRGYCPIDLSDSINIVEIFTGNEITQKHFIELVGKLVVSDKQIINAYNPFTGTIFRIELTDRIKGNFSNILLK
jgi:hypothetical protein